LTQPFLSLRLTSKKANNEKGITMNPQVEAVKIAVAILKSAFPGEIVGLQIGLGDPSFNYHGTKTYAEATEWLRSVGCSTREKHPFQTYTQLTGQSEGISWTTYPDELPPTCRKVTKTERIPKTKTVETGEFIEIAREVVECGPDPDEIAAAVEQPQPELAVA